MPEPRDEPGPTFRFVPEINITGIVTVLAVLGSVIAFVVTSNNRSDEASRDLSATQTSMNQQLTEIRQNVNGALTDIRGQIATLPDMKANLTNLERRVTDLETRYNVIADRITAGERADIEIRSDMAPLLRAAGTANTRH